MASYTSYVVSSDNENNGDSSPDPLAVSFNENRVRARPLTSSSPSKHNRISSPTKQARKSNTADLDFSSPTKQFTFSSPSKQMLLSTPRTAGASPWRIKVTVQAEPGSDNENMDSPTVKRVTHTKTTKVPLKDADASSPAKRRGRPRKSEAATKRKGTPVGKRASSKTRRSSMGESSAADVETDGTPKKRRGRPRKIVPPPAEDDIWGQARDSSVRPETSNFNIEADPAPKKRRGRPRKSIQPTKEDEQTLLAHSPAPAPEGTPLLLRVESDQHLETVPEPSIENETPQDTADTGSPAAESASPNAEQRSLPVKSTPPQTDLSRRLKERKNTPVANEALCIDISSDEDSGQESDVQIAHSVEQIQDETAPICQEHPEAEETTDGVEDFQTLQTRTGQDDEADGAEHEETHFAFDEGATRMPDDTTIIDSENFSMISVDSLPSGGALTSPANGQSSNTPLAHSQISFRDCSHLDVPSVNMHVRGSPKFEAHLSPTTSHPAHSLPPRPSPSAAPPRYKTPSVEPEVLPNPPPIEPVRVSPTEAQTPKIGRVVKAGVALQGVLDPNRVTPEAKPSQAVDKRQDHLDDLFRGFSDRTRRELHAGLRLGEQLAREDGPNGPSSPALSSPIKNSNPSHSSEENFSYTTAPQQSRLLTPEDQADDRASLSQPNSIQYPLLPRNEQASHLLSPVSNPESDGDEMSWRVDTPPVQHIFRDSPKFPGLHAFNDLANAAGSPDIWEAEAGHSSTPCEYGHSHIDKTPQIRDLFSQDGPIKPPRGRLPRIWRRESSGDFQYSDEADDSQMQTPPSTEPDDSQDNLKGKEREAEPTVSEEPDELVDGCDGESEASDDTGLFFQSNMPSLFNKKRSGELRRRTQKLDLSLNLDQSLLPESSPPPASKTPAMNTPNPFVNTPPHLAALRSSPVKSSPLRQELRSSDISSESAPQGFEESTLPLAPSSPFHTFVEGDTGRSLASDQRQLMLEVGTIDSSLRRIRDEADEYLDAYQPQERTLHDLTEVTEPSRTWTKESMALASSPPKQTIEESMIRPNRTYPPLFGNDTPSRRSWFPPSIQTHYAPQPGSSSEPDKATTPVAPRDENNEHIQSSTPMSGHFHDNSMTAMRISPPPAHPALKKLSHLPRVEPWTKTHYKALDALYQLYKKQPSMFSPTSAHSALNTALLTNFLNSTTSNFIGARYRAWGYNVIFTDALIVLCAAYMQLLTLDDIAEYEERAGKRIQIGDCGPGVVGETITAEKVVERLATVVLGEAVRRDEKAGKKVDKSGRLRVEWPQ